MRVWAYFLLIGSQVEYFNVNSNKHFLCLCYIVVAMNWHINSFTNIKELCLQLSHCKQSLFSTQTVSKTRYNLKFPNGFTTDIRRRAHTIPNRKTFLKNGRPFSYALHKHCIQSEEYFLRVKGFQSFFLILEDLMKLSFLVVFTCAEPWANSQEESIGATIY